MIQEKISAGSYDINKFLSGGYENDVITTLFGPAGSGKTNLCTIVAVCQAKRGKRVIFVDTEGGFSCDRVKQLVENNQQETEKVLENILLLKPTSFEEQEFAFGKLLHSVKKEQISLIIIDSIAMHYRLELGDAIKSKDDLKIHEVNRKLAMQLRALSEIARKQNIPVIVTNQVYSDFLNNDQIKDGAEKGVNMVGGDLLRYWSKCLIEMQNNRGKRKMILRKHRSLPEDSLEFEIVNSGIRKKGLF